MKKENNSQNESEQNQTRKPIIKNQKVVKAIVVLLLVAVSVGAVVGCGVKDGDNEIGTTISYGETEIGDLDFYIHPDFVDNNYLTLDESDFLYLIEKAMDEVDSEYKNIGCTPVFDEQDSEFSRFDKYLILGILQQESSFRLLEVKDESKGIFNVDNYARFYGEDENGVIYYGPGMMSSEAVEYVVNNDRRDTNNFKDYQHFLIDGEKVSISFENINPYDYVLQSGAKTQAEIEQALAECIMLNAKCIYVCLNRFVKDYVKAGTHDHELGILESYSQFKNLTTEEKQIAFALMCYNNGGSITNSYMEDKKLFAKDEKGNYIINVEYASKVMKHANEFRNDYENALSIE